MRLPMTGREIVKTETLETYASNIEEAQQDIRLLQRQIEDVGWTPINGEATERLSDVKKETREATVRRIVKYWLNDPQVGHGIDLHNYYVWGRGLSKPRSENRKLQAVIDEFWEDNDNKLILTTYEAQIQKSTELQIQGNVFITAFIDEDTGMVRLSDLVCQEVHDIIEDPNNRKKHLYYQRKFQPQVFNFRTHQYENRGKAQTVYYRHWINKYEPVAPGDPDYYGPGENNVREGLVFHLSTNRLSDGKFGNPRVARTVDWARAFTEFLRARTALMQAASRVAWKRKVKGNQRQVSRMATKWEDRLGGAAAEGSEMVAAGPRYAATVTENESSTLDPVRTDTGGANAAHDGALLQSMIAAGLGFPRHYLGDTGDANLATATAMELPVLKMCEAEQEYWENVVRAIIDRVILEKIRRGKLPRPKMGKFSDVEGPDVVDVTGTAQDIMGERGMSELVKGIKNGDVLLTEADFIKPEDAADDDTTQNGQLNLKQLKASAVAGDYLYAYNVALPNILQRQITETINSVVGMLQAFDSKGKNGPLTRWAFQQCLDTLGVTNVPEVLEQVFPHGLPVDRGTPMSYDDPAKVTRDKKPESSTAGEDPDTPNAKHARNADDIARAQESSIVQQVQDEMTEELQSVFATLETEGLKLLGRDGDADS